LGLYRGLTLIIVIPSLLCLLEAVLLILHEWTVGRECGDFGQLSGGALDVAGDTPTYH